MPVIIERINNVVELYCVIMKETSDLADSCNHDPEFKLRLHSESRVRVIAMQIRHFKTMLRNPRHKQILIDSGVDMDEFHSMWPDIPSKPEAGRTESFNKT